MRPIAARWWLPLSLVAGLAIGYVLERIELGRPALAISQLVPPVGVGILAVVCFRDLARRDRIGFLSIIGPAMAVALVSVALPRPFNWVAALLALGFIALFVFTQRFGTWWWRRVLRRPVPTPLERFERGLYLGIKAWADALTGDGALTSGQVAAANRALAEMRALRPPTPAWEALRDGYVDMGERWILLERDNDHREEAERLQQELADLGARHHELAGTAADSADQAVT